MLSPTLLPVSTIAQRNFRRTASFEHIIAWDFYELNLFQTLLIDVHSQQCSVREGIAIFNQELHKAPLTFR